jgi:hypothetical protein
VSAFAKQSVRQAALSLGIVLAGTAVIPLGLRAVNGFLPGADVTASYIPTIETPRQREPFDQAAANAVREAQPQYVVIGDSMAGVRINPATLSKRVDRTVAGLYHPGSPVAYWYLAFKNLVVQNELKTIRGAVFFFRDDQLTTQVDVDPLLLDRVAKAEEPELDRVLATHRLGRFARVHRAARAAYEYDRTRVWLEPRLTRAPAMVADDPARLMAAINTEVFALDQLRKFEASDLAQADDAMLDFDRQVDRSLLPAILQLAGDAGIRVAFVRAQRRPTETGPPAQSEALTVYLQKLEHYLTAPGAYYHDDRGDPDQPLSIYADGDHLTGQGRERYTERFAERHARFFQ